MKAVGPSKMTKNSTELRMIFAGAASPGPSSVARTASRSRQDRTPGGSVLGTPASLRHEGLSQLGMSAPGTGRRSSGVTPRADLGMGGYVGFYQQAMSTGRRSSLAISVRFSHP